MTSGGKTTLINANISPLLVLFKLDLMTFLSSATVTFTDNSVGQSAVTPGIAWSWVRIQSKPHFVLDVIIKREKLNLRTLLDVSNIIIKSEKCEVSKLLKELKFELRSYMLHNIQ